MNVTRRINNLVLIVNGGKGSGNFDHAGRPGLQGGSASTNKQQGLTISKSYSSEVSSVANQTLEKMQSEYGVKLSSVKLCSNDEWKGLTGDDLRKTKTLGMSCTGESEDTHEAFIILNDKYHMNEKVKSKPKSFEPPQFNADKSTEGVLRHEMLHCMFGVLGIKKCIKETDSEEKAIEYIRKLEEDVLNKIKKETKKSFPEVPYPDKKSDFFTNGRYISSYAETSASEYLAEIASNPTYSEFTKKANAILQKELQALAKEQSLFTNNSKKKYKILIFSEGYPASKTNKKKTKNIEERIDNLLLVVNGGKGSGNFGHSGRPGFIGGSGGRFTLSKNEYREAANSFPKGLSEKEKVQFEWYSFSPDHQASSSLNKEPDKKWVKTGVKTTIGALVNKFSQSSDVTKKQIAEDLSKYKKSVEVIEPGTETTISNKELKEYYQNGGDDIRHLCVVKKSKETNKYIWSYQSTIPTKEMFEAQKIIDDAIKNKGISFTKNISVERLVPDSMLQVMKDSLNKKDSYTQEGFTSVSAYPMTEKGRDMRMSFGNNKIKIIIPAGQKMAFMESFSSSENVKEQFEILLPSRSTFTKMKDTPGYDLTLSLQLNLS